MKPKKETQIILGFTIKDMTPKSGLVVMKGSPYGREQMTSSYEMQYPGQYEIVDVAHELIEYILMSKELIKLTLDKELLINHIIEYLVPHASEKQILELDIKVTNKIQLNLNS